jgi:hypothetical protein
MYSLLVSEDKKAKMTAKGIKKSFLENKIRHEQYLHSILTRTTTRADFNIIRSKRHTLQTVRMIKRALCSMDDKRFILSDGIRSVPYGHYRIRTGELS